MKKLFALLLFFPSAAFADIKQEFVTSAQITVDMPYVVTNKVGTTYSLSGNNITPSVTVPKPPIEAASLESTVATPLPEILYELETFSAILPADTASSCTLDEIV